MSVALTPGVPGEHTFKIFGRQSPTLVERVSSIVARAFGPLPPEAVSVRASSGERYLSVTIVVWVDDRRQLETAYAELKAEPEVLLYI
jgi:putative lipoic acid-binding regulatory protein